MTTVTLSSKGQLTIPRNLRDRLGLTASTRPPVKRVLSLDDMERAIAAAVDRADP